MDDLAFATIMIDYQRLSQRLKDMEKKIVEHVMKVEESQKIAGVTARYTHGRTVYDYETAGKKVPRVLIEKHTELIRKTDWRKVCEDAGVDKEEIPVKSVPVPSVKVVVDLQ